MCGIVGLHLKDPELHPRLGELLTAMLDCMEGRGPDSAGIALYRDDPRAGPALRCSLRSAEPVDWHELAARLSDDLGVDVSATPRGSGAVFVAPLSDTDLLLSGLRTRAPHVVVVGYGHAMEVYKDVGAPGEVCDHYDVPKCSGYQGIGHTRMATESAVTTEHSHPFAPAPDVALVHNGSFSNHASLRRRLARAGVQCATDNDSEVAAHYLAHKMRHGADLDDALRAALADLDGFFTLLVTTRTQFAVVRDSFACKPMVVAETPGFVAVASEYHALAGLPGISAARVFEPAPEEVHTWTR